MHSLELMLGSEKTVGMMGGGGSPIHSPLPFYTYLYSK